MFVGNVALLTACTLSCVWLWAMFVPDKYGGDLGPIAAGFFGAIFVYPIVGYWVFGWG